MSRQMAVLTVSLLAGATLSDAEAQDLVISNARIIVGNGQVIEKGSIVVKDGRIASVAEGAATAAPRNAKRINAAGMTVMAGFIDDHRHLIQGRGPDAVAKFMKDSAADRMRELLEAGFTTVQSGGDDNDGILELKKKVESGEIKGPRIVASGQVPTARLKNEAEVRAAVDKVIHDGADSVAEVHYPDVVWPFNPTDQESKNLAAGIDEAKKLGVEFQVHAVSDLSLVAAVRLGAKKLVHSVNINWVTAAQAKEVAAAGAEVASITGFGSPNFDVFSHDNQPKFRDGKPWPSGIVDSEGVGQEAGYMPVNLRTLYDNGVDVSYATDTTFDARGRAGARTERPEPGLLGARPDQDHGPELRQIPGSRKRHRHRRVRQAGRSCCPGRQPVRRLLESPYRGSRDQGRRHHGRQARTKGCRQAGGQIWLLIL